MKRLFVSVALVPLLNAGVAQAETKISTATTAPVATATAAAGHADDLTIEAAGSIKPAAAGAAVTLNSPNIVKNAGTISFNNLDGSTGILVLSGGGGVINAGTISLVEDYTAEDTDKDGDLDGPLAKGAGRFGIRLTGAGAFAGDIRNDAGGAITVEGNDSAGIQVEPRLAGNLISAGAVTVTGDRSVGISATAVAGDVRVTGPVSVQGEGASAVRLGDVDGGVRLQNAFTATGYRYTDRLADAARAKLDADDLKQSGAAVRITGNVGKGVLLDRPPADANPADPDEDKDGVPDAQEGTAVLTAIGAAPALDIGSERATAIGAVGTGDDGFGLVIRGQVIGHGVNDGVAATAIRIGQAGGGTTAIAGGINNQAGVISAQAYGADVTAQGGSATALLLNAGAVVPALRNSGTIKAVLTSGSQDARAVVDLSGTLGLVENTGVIRAVSTPKTGSTAVGQAVALDLRANSSGAVVRQIKATATSQPAIVGDVLFGAGDDRLELSGGTLTGAMAFGAGADTLVLDGGASATGRLTDTDGRLTLDIREGRLSVTNTDTVQLTTLSVGAKGVLAVNIDPAANTGTAFKVSGVASLATGAQVDLSLASLLKSARSYEIIRAGSLQAGALTTTLAGAPYLYAASLRADAAANALVVDLRPKTAAELGLNRSGAEAYGAVFNALDKDRAVQAAFLAQKTQAGFAGLYDQMLPDHSGGALMSAHAISGAISQAVSQPVARQGIGETGVWAQEIMFRVDRDRDQAQGFRAQGFGLATGLELVGEANALGVSGSFVSTDYKDKGAAVGERISINVFEGGLYWRLQAGGLHADARAGLGYVRFDSDRRLGSADLNLATRGKWSGWIADVHAGASYEAQMGWAYARPELSLDYLRLTEDGYQEAGGGPAFDLKVDSRNGDLLTGEALLALGARFGDEAWWGPELKLGWRAKLSGDSGKTTARFTGGTAFTLDPEAVASGGAVARLGIKGEAQQVLYSFDAGAVFDNGYREYDVRGVVRFMF
ncbi:autotransporter domain-containing protein [Phenylobacterium hankyongense]|uniref:Autotransporter domain-containing protein n=1 Tax=Phenylobacterium hankyongense TaxID=1813876 RepID=A0A328AZL7_9CAUL|nr:autotransporter outer membrane beta-barrel domain-containing protein [Phenylobacterium hankyongense]RAK59044.1 autotransporter domain-containing protein [Phenylobacterium hankyongense]